MVESANGAIDVAMFISQFRLRLRVKKRLLPVRS